jgi:hypothetical protein
MSAVETGRYVGGLHTVAVFKDLEWARRAGDELRRRGFATESLTVIAKLADGVADWIAGLTGRPAASLALPRVGDALVAGPLVETLDGGTGHLGQAGLASTMTRAGFQVHDGQIFEALVARGGVLVAVRNEPRAADALALFHSYGGANAAIGAWVGRL